jgi:hypothetical protein
MKGRIRHLPEYLLCAGLAYSLLWVLCLFLGPVYPFRSTLHEVNICSGRLRERGLLCGIPVGTAREYDSAVSLALGGAQCKPPADARAAGWQKTQRAGKHFPERVSGQRIRAHYRYSAVPCGMVSLGEYWRAAQIASEQRVIQAREFLRLLQKAGRDREAGDYVELLWLSCLKSEKPTGVRVRGTGPGPANGNCLQ